MKRCIFCGRFLWFWQVSLDGFSHFLCWHAAMEKRVVEQICNALKEAVEQGIIKTNPQALPIVKPE